MRRRLSSSSTSSEPVEEPMNTLTPAQPGRRYQIGQMVDVSRVAAEKKRRRNACDGGRPSLSP